MGRRGSEFKCHGECQIDWRQLWSKYLQPDARPECLRCNGCKYLIGLSGTGGAPPKVSANLTSSSIRGCRVFSSGLYL
jgi:hypothetical protein